MFVRIKEFEVVGFKSENRKAILSLSAGSCSVIFGPNGVGKTTLLQIISAFLSKTESVLLANKVKRMRCVIVDSNGKERSVSVTQQGAEGYEWDTREFPEFDKLKSLSIGVERGTAPQNLSIQPSVIFDFLYRYHGSSRRLFEGAYQSQSRDIRFRHDMQELAGELSSFLRRNNRRTSVRQEVDFDLAHLNINSIKMENIEDILSEQFREANFKATKNIQSALFDTLAALIDNPELGEKPERLSADFIKSLKKYQERIKSALSGGEINAFMNSVIATLDSYCKDDAEEVIINKPIVIKLFRNIVRELESEDANINSINIILSAFNRQLEDGKKLVVDPRRNMRIEVDGEFHNISELSSGERHILTFLTLISTVGRNKNFIIIDEPEISLNLKWQREILSIIQNILPRCQIIVASHSPAISQDPGTLCKLQVLRVN